MSVMKRAGIGVAAAFAVLLAGLFVLPSFVDWTDYRDSFSDQIYAATGRKVTIDGEVSLSLLPRPAVTIEQVRVGSIPGATQPEFLTAEAVDVDLALGPLFQGQIKFVSIRVNDPVVYAERLLDGQVTWQMPQFEDNNPEKTVSARQTELNLAVDQMSIINGTIAYVDRQAEVSYRLTGVNADLTLGSLNGPYAMVGRAIFNDKTWTYDLAVGVMQPERPTPITIRVDGPDGSLQGKFVGRFNDSDEGLTGAGQLSIGGSNGALALAEVLQSDPLSSPPAPLLDAFQINAKLDVSASALNATDIQLDVGGLKAEGRGGVTLEEATQFDLSLRARRINLSSWLETRNNLRGTSFTGKRPLIQSAHAQEGGSDFGFRLPEDLAGNIDVRADLIEWRGQVMRNAVIAASLVDAELTVTDMGAELPGSSTVQVNGFIKAREGQPVFDLQGGVSSRNLRGLLAWIDVEPDGSLIPPSRLNSLDMSSRVVGTLSRVSLEDLSVELDTTTLNGRAEFVTDALSRLNLELAVSRLDLDSYLPALQRRLSDATDGSKQADLVERDGVDAASDQTVSALPDMEINLSLTVGQLTAGGYVMRDFNLGANASDGAIHIRKASVDDLEGARVGLSGRITNLSESLEFTDVEIDLAVEDLAKTARAFSVETPIFPLISRPGRLEGRVSGTVDEILVAAEGAIGELTVDVRGQVKSLQSAPQFDLQSHVKHPSYAGLLSDFGVGVSEVSPPLGPMALSGSIKSEQPGAYATAFEFGAGDNAVSGELRFEQQREKNVIAGVLDITRADLDRLVPPNPRDVLTRESRSRSSSGSAATSERWSAEPIDLSILADVDATLQVTAGHVSGRGLIVEDFVAPVSLSNGVLDVPNWTGRVYGGAAVGQIKVSTQGALNVETRITVQDAQIAQVGGVAATSGSASGSASLTGTFTAQGNTQRALVATLDGQGTLAANGLDTNGSGQGAFARLALAPVRALSQIGGLLGGGVTSGFAAMSAGFSGTDGVFALTDATIESNVYSGEFTGTIDFPRWWIESEGRVRLQANVITQLLGNRLQLPSLIPISISGSLDGPNVRMDAFGRAEEPPGTAPSSTQPAIPMADQPPNPLDLFQGILNELAKPQ